MTDLHDHFQRLDEQPTPNLWSEIEARARQAQLGGSRTVPWSLIGVALLLLTLAIGTAALIGAGVIKLPVRIDRSPAPESSPAHRISLLPGCAPGVARCQDLPAGTYFTTGQFGFMPGLEVTLPAGWSITEQDAGMLSLFPVADANLNDGLLFWRDVVAVDQEGHPAIGVGTAPNDLATFLANDPRVIVSERGTATIGDGIPAITLVMRANPAGPNDDPEDCPGVSCANVLTDPINWVAAFGMAVDVVEDPELACPCSHAVRLYLAAIGPSSDRHTFVVAVMVYAPDPDSRLASFEAVVQPIIDSVRLPAE